MPVSLRKSGFAFGEVVDILTTLYGVHESKRDTFVARLQQLQRMGLPRDANTGRGIKVRYVNWQLADLMVFMDLLDCGIPPNFIADHFGNSVGAFSIPGSGEAIQRWTGELDDATFLVIEFHALAYYRSSDPERKRPSFADHVLKTRKGPLVQKAVAEHPGVAINLSQRLRELRTIVEKILPDRIEDITFFPTKSGLKEN